MASSRFARGAFGVAAGLLFAGGAAAALAAKPPTFMAAIFDASGKRLGFARFVGVDTGGTQITVDVSGLVPGHHGLHVHEVGSCNALRDTSGTATPFGAAGGHFDPAAAKMHKSPDGGGHAGDLPVLDVDDAGRARLAFYAVNLQVSGPNTIVGRAIVIHANPDNYTDTPPNGGSGGRVACGEIGAAVE
ncbi:MAG: superoxide dismutase family protein [Candidatus Velthaea sp.]